MRIQRARKRKGAVVPVAAVCMVALLGFLALSIDLGILMIARNQCQSAADAAAMAGARTLTGDTSTNNNYANVAPNAVLAAASNSILNTPINTSTQLTVTIGDYYYNTSTSAFTISPSSLGYTGDNWTLVQATVTSTQMNYFAKAFGPSSASIGAVATAVHRPRDVSIVVDFSGSMRFESLLGCPYSGNRTLSMNPSTVYPQFGHYATNASQLTYSSDQQASTGEIIGAANDEVTTTEANSTVANSFYGDSTAFGTSVPAFTAASSAYMTTPGGDVPLKSNKGSGSTYASCVSQFVYNTTTTTTRDWRFELDGYSSYANGVANSALSSATTYTNAPFYGYCQGPGYWGKTFMTWPPDPRVPLTTTYYTSSQSLTAPGQIEGYVKQMMTDLYTADGVSTTNVTSTTANSTNYVWQKWTSFASASALQTYLTGTLALPTTSNRYLGLMRLYNRNGGTGMPKNSSGTAMPCDFRARFFTTTSGAPLMDDSKLYNSSGTMNVPSSSTYLINYAAILDWIKNSGTCPFPAQMRAGGIIYYSSIPSTITTSTFPPPDPNQRFWKQYIDEVLGFMQTGGSGSNPSYSDVSNLNGYGGDIAFGTAITSGQPTGWPGTSSTATYIKYTDNPLRPLLRGWFGPLAMIDYLGNYNASDSDNNNSPRLWWPGTATEAPTYQTKLGIQAALSDILQNHPNDNVSVIFFSSPKSSATASGYYNFPASPMSRNQRQMINSLWFCPTTISTNAEVSIYNSSGASTGMIYTVPRANGGTCYAMPLMLAYNQFSSNPALVNYTANAPAGTAGGLGRVGSSKILVFETDGMVNTGCSANLVSSTTGQGYYQVRIADANNYSASGTEFPTNVTGVTFATGATQSQTIATQICANLSAGGFSTSTKPVKINCIAFGSLFESTNNSTYKTNALQNLATLEVIGNVQSSGATTLATNKIITGSYDTRITNLQAAFSGIYVRWNSGDIDFVRHRKAVTRYWECVEAFGPTCSNREHVERTPRLFPDLNQGAKSLRPEASRERERPEFCRIIRSKLRSLTLPARLMRPIFWPVSTNMRFRCKKSLSLSLSFCSPF